MTASDLVFTCVIVKETDGYSALCLDLDVASEGKTPAAAKKMLAEAVEVYLDSAIDSNLPYLRPVPKSEDPRELAPKSIVKTYNLRVNLRVSAVA